ncbi:hypothetical protein GCM10023085_53310 [Actinomadura viridis]
MLEDVLGESAGGDHVAGVGQHHRAGGAQDGVTRAPVVGHRQFSHMEHALVRESRSHGHLRPVPVAMQLLPRQIVGPPAAWGKGRPAAF